MTPPTFHWAPALEAGAALGVSARTLHRWRSIGLLQAGKHWRRKFPNPNSPILYDLEACDAVMREQAARDPGLMELSLAGQGVA